MLIGWISDPGISRRTVLARGAALLVLTTAGCQTEGPKPPKTSRRPYRIGRGPIHELRLFTSPAALNFDNEPGADGFTARVYALRHSEPNPVLILEGSLEILLFDAKPSGASAEAPLQTWIYSGRSLRLAGGQSSLGYHYNFSLRWDDAPAGNQITIQARYLPENGNPVVAQPVSLAVKSR